MTSGEGGGGGGANQLPVEDILGIKNNSPVVDSISSPGSLHEQQQSHAGARQANSVLARGGGLHSPRRHGEGKARSKEDSDGVNSVDGGGVVAGRPDSLGFQASSPSLATQQQQHSPLVAAGKTNKVGSLSLSVCLPLSLCLSVCLSVCLSDVYHSFPSSPCRLGSCR